MEKHLFFVMHQRKSFLNVVDGLI